MKEKDLCFDRRMSRVAAIIQGGYFVGLHFQCAVRESVYQLKTSLRGWAVELSNAKDQRMRMRTRSVY